MIEIESSKSGLDQKPKKWEKEIVHINLMKNMTIMSLMTWVVKRRDVYKNDLLKHFLSTFYKDGLILFETNDINCDK